MKCPKCGFEGNKPHQKRCIICDAPLVEEQPVQSEALKEESVEVTPPSSPSLEENIVTAIKEDGGSDFVQQTETPLSQPELRECPRCHQMVPADVKFCPECGCNISGYIPLVEEPHEDIKPSVTTNPEPILNVEPDPVPAVQEEEAIYQTIGEAEIRQDSFSSSEADDPTNGWKNASIDYGDSYPQPQQKSSAFLTVLLVIAAAFFSLIVGVLLNIVF